MMKKRFQLDITDLNHQGNGVGRIDGFTYFVPGALEGETVLCEEEKVNPNFGYAKLVQIIKASPYRTQPICAIFGVCGGCELMHLAYDKQLEFKKKMAENTFKRLGKLDIVVDEIIGMDHPYYYRNKVQVPFGTKDKKVICGYYQRKSHDIVPLDTCYIQPEFVTELVLFVRNLANEFGITTYDEKEKKGCLRHVLVRTNDQDEMLLVIITHDKLTNSEKLVEKITASYPKVVGIIQNSNRSHTNVILGKKDRVLFGAKSFVDRILGMDFKLSYDSFFQVNREQTEKLYQVMLAYANPQKRDVIIDAYCGVGTMSLLLAKHAKAVYGIEVVEEAIISANHNAILNEIDNTIFITNKVEDMIDTLLEYKPSIIVLDPPRKGVDKAVLDSIIAAKIKRIVYVSCDVATLARDLSILSEQYHIKNTTLVDMFPQTATVEAVCLLERR